MPVRPVRAGRRAQQSPNPGADSPRLGDSIKLLAIKNSYDCGMQLATTPMSERRRTPRVRVLKSARIVVNDRAPKIESTIRNISDGGCLLQISTTFGVPHEFDLVMPDGTRKHCQVMWRTETRMGVSFR